VEGVNSQLSRVKETLLYTSCKVFYPQMTLQPSLFVRWLAGLTAQREVNAATLHGETPEARGPPTPRPLMSSLSMAVRKSPLVAR
jgi:hypothetical protein